MLVYYFIKTYQLPYISERLGHASMDITTSTYAHLLKELRECDSSKTASIFEESIKLLMDKLLCKICV